MKPYSLLGTGAVCMLGCLAGQLIYLIDQAAYHFLPQLELIDVRRRLAMIGWANGRLPAR